LINKAVPRLVLKELPRYDCLVEASKQFPDLEPAGCEAFMHLMRAGEEVARVMNTHFSAHNITQGRFMIMMLLLEKGGDCLRATTPAELADLASVSRATITGLLDTLERDGFVCRLPDPTDRRQMSVHLTASGHQFMHDILPDHFRLITQITSVLTHNELTMLTRLLIKVCTHAAGVIPGTKLDVVPSV
jgi:DNA-binding MarR family transcriptional regulator